MQTIICKNYEEMSQAGARIIASQLTLKPDSVLGLATGSTPIGMYSILGELCAKGEIDFSRVSSYNLDEYYPISPDNPQSYKYFMEENLFSKVNIDRARTHIPSGNSADPEKECKEYDELVAASGGVDIQVLGIGQNGHIGFNEPDEYLLTGTHVTGLTESTIKANARFFDSIDEVPTKALTMGMATIMTAKKIILLANGKAKHDAVKALLDDKITTQVPATLLKLHADVVLICDEEAYYG